MRFYKMHGIGNDYIFFDCMQGEMDDPSAAAVRLSDRHRSVGGDGIILLCPSERADVRMRMFNADGSEGRMCGNGIRCLGKLARDLGYVKGDECAVETLSGVRNLRFVRDEGAVSFVRVDMGRPVLSGRDIPSTMEGDTVVSRPLDVGGVTYPVTLVSMGNPHCVVFEDPEGLDIGRVGPLFENSPVFPERVNTEFVKVISRREISMRVWERGSGETLACGTGACASVVAACLNGLCERGVPVRVRLLGGDLDIEYSDGGVSMEGPAELSFVGEADV